jgi:hypothetical protein
MKIEIRKSHLAILPIAIVFAIGILLFVSAYSKKDALSTFTLWGSKETTVESQNKDSDNDGLRDWEENLYKTDPLNPDTDADGYLDGEEINSGHNPSIKGPNDKLDFYPLPVGDKYNITDKIFSDIDSVLKSYIEQKDEYARDHPEIKSSQEYLAQVSQSTLEEMFTRAILYNEKNWAEQVNTILEEMPEVFQIEIADKDINISENNGSESIKNYVESLISYIQSEEFLFQEKSSILLKDSLQSNNFDQLDELIKINDDEIAKMVEIPVPLSWKETHKQVLKTVITMRNIYISLRGYDSDPVKATVAINETQRVLSDWEKAIEQINKLSTMQNLNLSI